MSDRMIKVGIQGASGRMGARLIDLIRADAELTLVAAVDRPDHPRLGEDVGLILGCGALNTKLTAEIPLGADVWIDFSTPGATLALARVCRDRKVPLVVGTTGLESEEKAELAEIARSIAVLAAPNMSRAVNLLMKLTADAARAIGRESDVEIVERHHHFKKDSPSGTAVRLAEIVAEAIGSNAIVHGRSGLVGERPRGEIGVHALRVGDNPGEHTVVFGLMGETLELSHRALSRDGFARGALDAAKFLIGKPAGSYKMSDLLE